MWLVVRALELAFRERALIAASQTEVCKCEMPHTESLLVLF